MRATGSLLLVVRALPALLVYRGVLPMRRRVQVGLVTATALRLLVALAEIGLPENAGALVGAAVLIVLVLPALAVALRRPDAEEDVVRSAPDRSDG